MRLKRTKAGSISITKQFQFQKICFSLYSSTIRHCIIRYLIIKIKLMAQKGKNNLLCNKQITHNNTTRSLVSQIRPQGLYNFGLWTEEEQLKYIIFMDFFLFQLKNPNQRKSKRMFKKMAIFIATRDGIQCRSHHMKQLKAYGPLQSIIKKYKGLADLDQYNRVMEDHHNLLSKIKNGKIRGNLIPRSKPQRVNEPLQPQLNPVESIQQSPEAESVNSHQGDSQSPRSPPNAQQYYWVWFPWFPN